MGKRVGNECHHLIERIHNVLSFTHIEPDFGHANIHKARPSLGQFWLHRLVCDRSSTRRSADGWTFGGLGAKVAMPSEILIRDYYLPPEVQRHPTA